jgi:hypothetical protein
MHWDISKGPSVRGPRDLASKCSKGEIGRLGEGQVHEVQLHLSGPGRKAP